MLNRFKSLLFNSFVNLNSERKRIDWAKNQIGKIRKGESIIDVGAGEMLFKKYCGHLKYTSQDLGKYNGSGDKKGLYTGQWNTSEIDIISDINNIPVKTSIYDNVLCTAVLEHVPYPDMTIKELSRILKHKGKLILDAPFCSQTHFSPYFFSTGFSINWYKLILPKYGFKITKISPYGNYFDFVSLELLRLPFVGRKYSIFGPLSYILFIFLLPLVVILQLLSKYSSDSDQQLCFGHHVLAEKK